MLDTMIAANRRRAVLLMLAIFALLALVVYAAYIVLAFDASLIVPLALFTMVSPWVAYFGSHRLVIAATGAFDADPIGFRQLHNIVEEMAIAAGLPKPRVMIVDDVAPNAFATGRDADHAVIAVTTGLLEKLDREQLQAVIGHELAHIANRDILVGTLAASLTGVVMFIADIALRLSVGGGNRRRGNSGNGGGALIVVIALVVLILAPIGALLLRSAVSRRREHLADASSAALTRNPTGMRRALEALATDSTELRRISPTTSALWIEEPNPRAQRGMKHLLTKMYATHPPMEERIAAMRTLESR